METKEIVKKEETNKVVPILKGTSLFFDIVKFEHAQRVAQLFAKSTMVPKQFQGNIANCVIALNLSERMQVDPFMLMQNMYIVHGRPGIEAKLAIALINQSGRFSELEYEIAGENDKYGCRAYAKKISTRKILYGPKVDIAMAKAEGWYNKEGSKWKTIPELMLQYRAAMFFARTYCPDVLLGMLTREELQDIVDITPNRISASSFEQSIENPQCSNINKKTYQPLDLPEIQPKEETQHEEKIIQHFIDSFKNKSEKGILQFAEEHKSEILTWPDKVFDAWCDKFKRTIGEDYAEWTRRPFEEKKEEIKTKGLDFVKCPDDGEHKSLAQCQNRDGQDKPCKMYQEKNCLERWSE